MDDNNTPNLEDLGRSLESMNKVFGHLDRVLDDLARKIDYMADVTGSVAQHGDRRSGSSYMPFNMTYDSTSSDILRGKKFNYFHQASDNEKEAFFKRRKDLKERNEKDEKTLKEIIREKGQLQRAFKEKKRELEALEGKHRRGEIDDIDYSREREKIEKDLNETIKKLNSTIKRRDTIKSDISKRKEEIQKSFNETVDDRYENIFHEAWKNMDAKARAKYGDSEYRFQRAQEAQHEFNERYDARREASTLIQNSGFENTGIGKFAQRQISRQQRYDNMANFGRKLTQEGGAESIASAMFGKKGGKAASLATKGLTKFGGVLTKVGSKFLPVVGQIMMVVDAVKALGKAASEVANEWKKQTAEFIKFQTEQENTQYEQAKQHLILETQMEIEKISYQGDLSLKAFDMNKENFMEAFKIQNEAFVKSMEIGAGAMTTGVAQNAYNAAEASIDMATEMRKASVHRETRAQSLGIYAEMRGKEAEAKLAGLQADMQVADVAAENAMRESANRMQQYMMNNIAGGMNKGGIGGYAQAIMGATRDEKNNTTTGAYGEGRTNEITGEATQLKDAEDMNLSAYGAGAESKWLAAANGWVGGGREGWEAEQGARLDNFNAAQTRAVDAIKTKVEQGYNKQVTALKYSTELREKEVEFAQEQKEAVIDAANRVEKNWLKVTEAVENYVRKFDEKMNDLGLNIGMWNQSNLFDYKNAQLAAVKEIAEKYGKSEEEIAKYQSAYTEISGRNKMLNKTDIDKMAGMGVLTGNDEMVAKYVGEMEFFNKSAEKSVDLIFEEMKAVNRVGLNARKYMKDVTDNLKLANKYNFKEGTKSLREMVKWAQQTKFNMQSLGSMLEKVQEGGIEGVITQSAGFQVLGGMAAINSDPLGMLYDAWADPQAYARRMQDMTKGFGTFNKKTGETTFNMPESMQIAQIAKLQGRSAEELREEIARRNQTKEIKANLTQEQKRNLTDEQVQYLSNAATYDTESRTWKVNKMVNGEIKAVDISQIQNSKDLEGLVSNDHDTKMEQMLGQIVSVVARERGEQTRELADQASMKYKETLDHFNERLKKMHDNYDNNREELHNQIIEKQKLITESTKSFLDKFATDIKDEGNAITKEADNIRAMTTDIATALGGISEVVTAAENGIRAALQQQLGLAMPGGGNPVADAQNAANSAVSSRQSSQDVNRASNGEQTVGKRVWEKYFRRSGHGADATRERVRELSAISSDNVADYKKVLEEGWNDLLDEMEGIGLITNDDIKSVTMDAIRELKANLPTEADYQRWSKRNEGTVGRVKTDPTTGDKVREMVQRGDDIVASGNGNPMYINAAKVTPIKDGVMETGETDGADTIYAAKIGGPIGDEINKGFRKIGKKIDVVDRLLTNQPLEALQDAWSDPHEYAKRLQDLTKGLGKYNKATGETTFNMPESMQIAQIAKMNNLPAESVRESISERNRQENGFGGGQRNINVTLGGTLRLDCGNQQVDLVALLNHNPGLLRQVTQLIVEEFSSSEYGGKAKGIKGVVGNNRWYR